MEKLGFTPLGGGARPTPKIVTGPLQDLNPQSRADESAEEALRVAEERALLEQAAYARGVAEGRAQADAALAQLVQGMGEVIAELTRFRHETMTRYQSELLDLALEVARKVVDRELEQHPEHWIEVIREGVRRAVDRDHIRIRVAPVLHAFLAEHLVELRGGLAGVKDLELLEDPSLPPSGCVVETSYGDLDLGVDSQIGTIRTAMTEPV
jgi:flagellar assembly protein FliH